MRRSSRRIIRRSNIKEEEGKIERAKYEDDEDEKEEFDKIKKKKKHNLEN